MRRPLRELREWWVRRPLAACDVLGSGFRRYGTPFVDNQGRIEIGSGLFISAAPVRSHLATGAGGLLEIGNDVRIAHGAAITAHLHVVIGDNVSVGAFVMILDDDFHGAKVRTAPEAAKPITIGRGVILGAGTIVLRGAIIGDGAVIGPDSVVSRVVPPGGHFAGAPARPDGSMGPPSMPPPSMPRR